MNIFKFQRRRVVIVVGLVLILIIGVYKVILTSVLDEWRRASGFLSDQWKTDCVFDRTRNVKVCSNEFVVLKDVVLKPDPFKSLNDNPDPIFTLKCEDLPEVQFHPYSHLVGWYQNIKCLPSKPNIESKTTLTIMVKRYEYAHVFFAMADMYNVYVLSQALKSPVQQTNVVLWDQHPKGLMDDTWTIVFPKLLTIQDFKQKRQFSTLAWNIIGYNSPLLASGVALTELPYLEDFRGYFLSRFKVEPSPRLNCQHLSVLFIWRHNYVAHPGNPSGLIKRKIYNEADILKTVQDEFPDYKVKGVQLDSLSMKDQMKLITSTDILIGVHGAGLTNGIFLPQHAGLIELFPIHTIQHELTNTFAMFKFIANWRKLKYISWRNPDRENEHQTFSTKFSPSVIVDLIEQMKGQIC